MNVTVERPIGELSRRVTEVFDPVVVPGFAALNEGTALYFTCAHTDMNNFLVARPEVPVHSIDEMK